VYLIKQFSALKLDGINAGNQGPKMGQTLHNFINRNKACELRCDLQIDIG
jgi:hypothetical protein